MAHAILLLDDDLVTAESTAKELSFYDASAEIIRAGDVDEARQKLQERGDDIAYIVSDLLMQRGRDQGVALIEWVLSQGDLNPLPILVLTQHPDMAKSVPKGKTRRVTTVIMTNDISEISAQISRFVEHARTAFDRRQQGA